MPTINRGFLALLSAAALLGTFGVLIRQLGLYFDTATQVAVRTGAAFLLALIIVLFLKSSLWIPRHKIWALIGFCTVFPLSLIAFTVSINQTKASNSLFMLYAGSIAASFLLGTFYFKERFSPQKLVSIILVTLGLGVFLTPLSIDSLSIGVIAGLVAGALEGTTHAFRKSLKDLRRETLLAYQYGASALFGLILAIAREERLQQTLDPRAVIVTLVFGLGLVGMGYLLLYGFKHYDVNIGSVVLASELFFALIINAALLAEYPSSTELIGGLIIFVAVAITSLERRQFDQILNMYKRLTK